MVGTLQLSGLSVQSSLPIFKLMGEAVSDIPPWSTVVGSFAVFQRA